MKRILVCLIACASVALASPRPALAQGCEVIATVVSVQGTVESRRAGDTEWQAARLNDTYCAGDTLRAQARSRADVALLNQSLLRLRANTEITLEGITDDETALVDLLKGAAHFFSRSDARSLEVKTPFTVAGVRGTEFYVAVEAGQTLLTVFEGRVVAANAAGSLMLSGGQSAVAQAGRAPVLRVVARPRDAVRWTLYYLPVIYPDGFRAVAGWEGMASESAGFYLKGDLQKAFDSIENVRDQDVRDPRFFTYRASLLLAVGSVDEAGADIERALSLAPNESDAFALQTIIAVVQNEKERASDVARRAVQAAPDSATARIALSYAQQARFDLEGARASLETAVDLEPDNALAWARLAELWSSFGRLGRALEAAQRAVALNPDLSRTQTVLGFAYLVKVETGQAREALERAIALDQADPLPRLGLGLAKIREGDLDGGSRDIEIAASLDPSNALVRSYLGKAYFEEKRTKLDHREYDVAKELDPRDPTPWFYDAIAKQTTNRPVEALHDIQKAIELNDSRAVYRSRLLLDSDLAARSASLGRIYSDLGFQNLALVEGWSSVNTDPSNFSAHRLLADSYAARPRHEIARVSELLQSQLLQPINITPIQPRLAESNLFLISSGGPGALSFNEFNPLFLRNRVAVQASGLAGEDDTWSGEGIVSGIYQKASASVGYTYFDTDGFRRNNDQQDNIADAFAQVELSYKTSVQAEYRYRDTENGDLELRFFPDDFRPVLDEEHTSHSIRGGLRHAFSPGSVLLASYMYQHSDRGLHQGLSPPVCLDSDPVDPFNPLLCIESTDQEIDDQKAHSGELQYLFRSEPLDWLNGLVQSINVTAGAGVFDISKQETATTDSFWLFPGVPDPFPSDFPPDETFDADVNHINLYLYSYIALPFNVTLTLGASGDLYNVDSIDSGTEDTNQPNPKVGITWKPFAGTTVRGAVFRTLKRTLITDQTLEPTQVAGFNQFFDDADATEAWRYGGAIDQVFCENLFGGIEFSKRDLEVPFTELGGGIDEADWDEYLGRAYLFWTPHDWLALSAEYQYERMKQEEDFAPDFRKVTTHRVPLGVRLFHPSGLSAAFQSAYWNQDGEFKHRQMSTFTHADDEFWVLDTAVSYRLPKRYGFITVGVTNLLDEDFKYHAIDLDNPIIKPDRFVFGRVTLSFP